MRDVVEVARAALLEVTPESTIGAPTGQTPEGDAVQVTFAAAMAGYPGWHWTVAVSTLEGEEPTALEVELMPGVGALLAPDWVPWSERLAEYQAAQETLAAEGVDDETVDSEDADDTDDDDDDDDLGSDVLHGGDLDGVDIDIELDDDDDSEDDDADDNEEDDESE